MKEIFPCLFVKSFLIFFHFSFSYSFVLMRSIYPVSHPTDCWCDLLCSSIDKSMTVRYAWHFLLSMTRICDLSDRLGFLLLNVVVFFSFSLFCSDISRCVNFWGELISMQIPSASLCPVTSAHQLSPISSALSHSWASSSVAGLALSFGR